MDIKIVVVVFAAFCYWQNVECTIENSFISHERQNFAQRLNDLDGQNQLFMDYNKGKMDCGRQVLDAVENKANVAATSLAWQQRYKVFKKLAFEHAYSFYWDIVVLKALAGYVQDNSVRNDERSQWFKTMISLRNEIVNKTKDLKNALEKDKPQKILEQVLSDKNLGISKEVSECTAKIVYNSECVRDFTNFDDVVAALNAAVDQVDEISRKAKDLKLTLPKEGDAQKDIYNLRHAYKEVLDLIKNDKSFAFAGNQLAYFALELPGYLSMRVADLLSKVPNLNCNDLL